MDKKQAKVGTVMREFKEGKLKSSSGQKVTNPKQAIAIGLSEAGLSKPKKMKEGGMMKKKVRKFQDGGETSSGLEHLERMAKRYGERPSKLDQLRADIKATGRAGMAAAKEAVGSVPQIRGAKELASRVRIPKSYDEEIGMKKGGKVHSDIAKDKPMMKKIAGEAVKGHEKRMHKMAKGGLAAGHKSADGCAVKGKTKGKMITMKSGGYC